MEKYILFIQGGGEGGYKADSNLVDSLKKELGNIYYVDYPQMQILEGKSDFGWGEQIGEKIASFKGEVILAGHS
jgi:hypothetical protein